MLGRAGCSSDRPGEGALKLRNISQYNRPIIAKNVTIASPGSPGVFGFLVSGQPGKEDREVKKLLAVAGLILAVVAFFPRAGEGGISGTAHDFSDDSWGDGQICKACHTPHFANDADTLLWNHQLPSSSIYTLYDQGTITPDGNLSGTTSLLCPVFRRRGFPPPRVDEGNGEREVS